MILHSIRRGQPPEYRAPRALAATAMLLVPLLAAVWGCSDESEQPPGPATTTGAGTGGVGGGHGGGGGAATGGAAGAGGSGAGGGGPAVPGAGKDWYTCPAGATYLGPNDYPDDVDVAIMAEPPGATICIEGAHRASAPVVVQEGQTLIGIGTDARISGAVALTPWTASAAVFRYDGPLATRGPTLRGYVFDPQSFPPLYGFTMMADDVFYDDQRMMRVLSVAELTGALPSGQAESNGEHGRFFFDYDADAIYITESPFDDPSPHVVELAVLENVIQSNGADGVTLQNLFLEKVMDVAIAATNSTSWLIEDCTIRFAHTFGIRGGLGTAQQRFVLRRVLLTNNGQYGMGGVNGSWFLLEDSEISWNNIANYRTSAGYYNAGAVKFAHILGTKTGDDVDHGLIVRNVESHHNIGDGFWTDIGNQYVLVEGSEFHHNERNGYFHEISCDIELIGNETHDNGTPIKNTDIVGFQTAGILVMSSTDARVAQNTVWAEPNGILVVHVPTHPNMLGQSCIPASSDVDNTEATRRHVVEDNQIYLCEDSEKTGGLFQGNPVLAARQNSFDDNTYYVTDGGVAYWRDGTPQSWSEWQALGYDISGERHVGTCAP